LGKESNWWAMGEAGPNGPCSEIYFDRGVERCTCSLKGKCTPQTAEEREACERFWEFWNLVFIEYNTDADGTTTKLERPSVDTGMGFERITAILQGAETNYDTDLFRPLMRVIRELAGHDEAQMQGNIVPYRVIADHGRAMTFLIADGVVPGNEERSYVLRMLIRRAIRFGVQLGLGSPFLGEVARMVIETMGDFYTELKEREEFILKAIAQEEERFERTYQAGMAWIEKLFAEKGQRGEKVITGEEAFFLHDTHGFHIQITEDIARERGFTVDREGFEREMAKQRERSRSSEQKKSMRTSGPFGQIPYTTFVGYDEYELENQPLIGMLRADHHAVDELTEGMEGFVAFNATPFYPEGGGQVADTGVIINKTRLGSACVLDVKRDPFSGSIIHHIKVINGAFTWHDKCDLRIDLERRRRTQRNHTATHILHKALREVLGHKGGIQAGSLVAPDQLRFDFTHFAPLTDDERRRIEEIANRAILSDLPVQISYKTLEEAKAQGAMALFPEDYQGKEKVRRVDHSG
jgi:alanyl-tRNA synthetase